MLHPNTGIEIGKEVDEVRKELATFRAKLDREKLARIVSDETGLSGDWCYDAADAIISYFKEEG